MVTEGQEIKWNMYENQVRQKKQLSVGRSRNLCAVGSTEAHSTQASFTQAFSEQVCAVAILLVQVVAYAVALISIPKLKYIYRERLKSEHWIKFVSNILSNN